MVSYCLTLHTVTASQNLYCISIPIPLSTLFSALRTITFIGDAYEIVFPRGRLDTRYQTVTRMVKLAAPREIKEMVGLFIPCLRTIGATPDKKCTRSSAFLSVLSATDLVAIDRWNKRESGSGMQSSATG